jgi:hypothetical protein
MCYLFYGLLMTPFRGRIQCTPTKFKSTNQRINKSTDGLFNIHPDYRLLCWYRDFALLNYGKNSRQSRPSVSQARLNRANLAPALG